MILLDTDHCTVLFDQRHRLHGLLLNRLNESLQTISLPIIAIEEQLRGFLAYINRERHFEKQIWPYHRMAELLRALAGVTIIEFDERALDLIRLNQLHRIKVGTQDLNIAAIALAHGALLLSANPRDFRRIPNLRVENWLI